MENIPYYDFSAFPLNSNKILENIDFAVTKGFKIIFINFGSFFPWSADIIVKSEFAYSDKLIDKIVNICRKNNIVLIPSLSILTNSDFILKDKKYKYLINNSINNNGLDISACGTSKLVEDIIDDIYSLMRFSEYLLIELPEPIPEESISDWSKSLNYFIKRISDNLINSDKKLILGCHQNCVYIKKNHISEGIKFILKSDYKKSSFYYSKSYNLDIIISQMVLNGSKYMISRLSGSEGFTCSLDIGEVPFYSDYKIEEDPIMSIIKNVDNFYLLLDGIWLWIRICWEELSLIYRNTDPVYRIKFSRSVNYLNQDCGNLQSASLEILDIFEKNYQPGVIKEWLNAKMDSVFSQLKNLEDIAKLMSDGN